MPRHPFTPFPQEHFDLLESVLTMLDAVQRPATKESEALVLAAVQTMDRLMELIPRFDPDAFPDGSLEQLRDARYWLAGAAIEYAMFNEAEKRLRAFSQSWEDYWKDGLPGQG